MAGSLALWCAIAGAWGGVLAWRFRNYINPDGISYLDIASQALRTGPLALIHRYWSPLYPALIALWEWAHRPLPEQEFAYIHTLNAVMYFIAAICFTYFFRELLRFRIGSGRSFRGDVVFVAFGFAIFFRFMNTDVTPFAVTPDLLVAGCVFVLAGLFFRIYGERAGWGTYVALGIAIAVGYWAKAAMLPAGLLLLGVLLLGAPRSKPRRRGVLMALGLAALLSAPPIILISKQVGHFSISEAGRLNYFWWMDGVPLRTWTGNAAGDKPLHGPRILESDPKTIEFGAPVPGTYPLWYDPAYWYAGAKIHFTLKRELRLLMNSARFYHRIFADLRLPLEGLIMLAILAYASRNAAGRTELLFLLWPVAILAMYALVVTELRYIAPFLAILWVVAYSAVLRQAGQVERILLTVLASVMLIFSLRETFASNRVVIDSSEPNTPAVAWWLSAPDGRADKVVARKLTALGLRPGDPIATVGDAIADFYARIARVRVTAEVVETQKFWSLRPDAASNVERRLAEAGAKVLIASNRPEAFQAGLWQNIPGTNYSVLKLAE